MASDRDPRRETLRHRQGGAFAFSTESRDPNDPVSATTGSVPYSQPIPPLSQYLDHPRYQAYPGLSSLNTLEQTSRLRVEPSHENYTHRDYEQSPLVNRGLPTHGIMPQPSHFAGPLTSHSPGGGHASHWDSPRSAQGADELMRSFENTTNVSISRGYTRQPVEPTTSAVPTSINRPPPYQFVPPSPGANPRLDPRYKVRKDPRDFFIVGRVFAVLWHENIGPTAPSRSTRSGASDLELTVGRFGERIYSDIRRMVVFREQDQCCWCYPVNTYGGQGVAKPSVDPSKHAIIHMKATAPYCGPNEPRMTKDPLEVIPASYDQKLDPMSRLNFGKIYTVEHNVKVLPVGMISEDSIARFQNYARREAQLWY